LIQKLLDAGVPGIEVASFVSPKAVPRMAGAGEIVTALKDSPAALSALVPNLKGYEMARDAGAKNHFRRAIGYRNHEQKKYQYGL
jgi:isopropylmalate/homocitrate/citramalate synthase